MSPSLPKTSSEGYEYMEKPLKNLDATGESGWDAFLKPWGNHKITLVHLAAYTGNLQMLERAVELGADLNATDERKRSALHHASFQGHVDVVKWLLDQPSSRSQLRLRNSFNKTALHEAIKGLQYDPSRTYPDCNLRNVAVVELLVNKGAAVNAKEDGKDLPLLFVGNVLKPNCDPNAVMWYEQIVKILVSGRASVNPYIKRLDETPLHQAVRLGSTEATRFLVSNNALVLATNCTEATTLHLAAGSQYPEILNILLENIDHSLIVPPDRSGKTLLHYAAETGHPENFRTLVCRGESLLAETQDGTTVLDVLFKHCANPVAYLTDTLDSQIEYEDGAEVILKFGTLLPLNKPQMDVVSTLINVVTNKDDMTILQHPLLETFLRLKWAKFYHFFLILFIVHVCFLILLFWYAVILLQKDVDSSLPRRLLLPFAFILLFHNVLQLLLTSKSNCGIPEMQFYSIYLSCRRHLEPWLSIICELIFIAVAIAEEFMSYHSDTSSHTWQPEPWLLNSISVVIFLAGIQMMLVIGSFPTFGCYTLMFYTVLKNVFKVFVAFVWFIVSFAFSFLIIFRGETQFHDWWVAIVKTVAMMTGEYDYDAFLTATNGDNSTDKNLNSETTLLPFMKGIIFLLFLMLANVVLMNIITALAVTDVKALVKTGELLRLMKHAELLAHFDRMTTSWIFLSDWTPDCLKKILKMEIADKSSMWRSNLVKRQWHRNGCISEELMQKLIALGQKNLESKKKSEMGIFRQRSQGDLTQIIFNLRKQIEELEGKNIRYSPPMQYSFPQDARLASNEVTVTVL